MKVPHVEVLAKHSGPESCGGYGNIAAEALNRGSVGGLLSSEITLIQVPTLLPDGEGHVSRSVLASYGRTCAESKNLACVEAFCTGIGRLVNSPVFKSWNGRIQRRKISWCVWVCALSRHKRRTRNQGVSIGWGGEGENPYVHLITLHESRTTTYYLRSRRTKGTLSPQRSLWR